jgi:hypothetical protein
MKRTFEPKPQTNKNKLLLSAGANPNAARNRRKSTPLHYAADGFITGPGWDANRQVGSVAESIQSNWIRELF